MIVNLPQESYLKYSNCNNEQFNDFNYWKLPVPFDLGGLEYDDYEDGDYQDNQYSNKDNKIANGNQKQSEPSYSSSRVKITSAMVAGNRE